MRVLLFEQWYAGHHLQYISMLIPPLLEMGVEVSVAVGSQGRNSREFASLIAPLGAKITIDQSVPDAAPWMPLHQRARLLKQLRDAIERNRPDHVLVPSADGQTTAMGLMRMVGLGGLPSGVKGEAGIHFGLGTAARTRSEGLKSIVYEVSCAASVWDQIHFVNPILYETITRKIPSISHRCDIFPHPVIGFEKGDKLAARDILGVPRDGRIVGFAGKLDERKAIDGLLAAFRQGSSLDDRLLLGGELCDHWRQLIASEYQDLVDAKRLIVLDRYLENAEFAHIFSAVDLVAVPYPDYGLLSGTLLEAVIAGRPVIASNFGWSGMMCQRFGLGWCCPMHDIEQFSATLKTALEGASAYVPPIAAQRLIEFHRPTNFAKSWLKGVRLKLGLPPDPHHRTWSWVVEALPS
jgi:glycosyltransferase involved in cell wall biosynthesis